MSILKIARMGHPILNKIADPLDDIPRDELTLLVEDMVETMQDACGTGLAAPQVHIPLRLVVYFIKAGRRDEDDDGDVPLTTLINPVITPIGDDVSYDWEGCLSLPGLTGLVPRYKHIHLKAETLDGVGIDAALSGFHARVVQHECDHLDGILYPQQMDDLSLLMFNEEMRHGISERAQKLIDKTDD